MGRLPCYLRGVVGRGSEMWFVGTGGWFILIYLISNIIIF